MGKICLLLIEDLYIIFIFLVAGIIFLCLNFKFYEIKKLTLAKNGVLLSKWKLNNTRWEDHQNTKEKCTLLMYFVHYVVYAVCKKEPGPTCFQISKVTEVTTALLSMWKESVGIILQWNTNIKAGFFIVMLKIFFYL